MQNVPLRIAWSLTLALGLPLPLATGAPQAPPAERSDPQRPGVPPPYYSYPFGPATTDHRALSVEEAIAAALAQASAYQQSRLDERISEED